MGEYSLSVTFKGGRPKRIPLPADVARAVLASVEARRPAPGPTDPLLVNARGERWFRTTLSEAFARLGKAADIDVRVASHTMRYSINAVARRVAKLDPQQRAELLNHVNTATLNVYDRLDNDEEGRAVRDASWAALKGLVGK